MAERCEDVADDEQEILMGNGHCGSPYTNDPAMQNVLVRPRNVDLSV
jgi:hypothetical protein